MLNQLSIHHVRNLQSVSFKTGMCNVFIGINGSGKTSILESLHLLSRGKSFRHHQPKRYISHHQPHSTVHALFSNGNSMAIQKSQDASSIMRLGKQPVYVQSELTRQLPTLLIDPSSMDILEVGSGSRRQLLDWITFHVKQGFHPQWVAYQRLLKQRNALLKKSYNLSDLQKQELASWDTGLANHAALITHYRQQVFEKWQPLFDEMVKQLLPNYAPYIKLRFSAGYNTDIPLDQLLQQRLAQDSHMGYTRIGCHRSDVQVLWVDDAEARQEAYEKGFESTDVIGSDDLNIDDMSAYAHGNKAHENSVNEHLFDDEVDVDCAVDSTLGTVREQAANVLSRGEKKLLITALRLSQLPVLMGRDSAFSKVFDGSDQSNDSISTNNGTRDFNPKVNNDNDNVLPLVLLDDINAELDKRALGILLKTLSALSCQVFITSLDDSVIDDVKKYWNNISLFHVKHGTIEKVTDS